MAKWLDVVLKLFMSPHVRAAEAELARQYNAYVRREAERKAGGFAVAPPPPDIEQAYLEADKADEEARELRAENARLRQELRALRTANLSQATYGRDQADEILRLREANSRVRKANDELRAALRNRAGRGELRDERPVEVCRYPDCDCPDEKRERCYYGR